MSQLHEAERYPCLAPEDEFISAREANTLRVVVPFHSVRRMRLVRNLRTVCVTYRKNGSRRALH